MSGSVHGLITTVPKNRGVSKNIIISFVKNRMVQSEDNCF